MGDPTDVGVPLQDGPRWTPDGVRVLLAAIEPLLDKLRRDVAVIEPDESWRR